MANLSKMADKRLGLERKVIGVKPGHEDFVNRSTRGHLEFEGAMEGFDRPWMHDEEKREAYHMETAPNSPEAQRLNGAHTPGFKPATETIIVAMKPCSYPTYLDQALDNQHGCFWLDDCRIPCSADEWDSLNDGRQANRTIRAGAVATGYGMKPEGLADTTQHKGGRFPANLLVSGNALDTGAVHKSGARSSSHKLGTDENGNIPAAVYGDYKRQPYDDAPADEGDLSRYFSLDAWWAARLKDLPADAQKTFPFLYVPKPSDVEKNMGCGDFIIIEVYAQPCPEKSLTQGERKALLRVDMGSYLPKVAGGSGTRPNTDSEWSTFLFGKNTMDRYQRDFISITRTATGSTMSSRILRWLTHLLISESMVDANSLVMSGINHVESAEKSNQLTITMSEKMASVLGVSDVALGTPLRISVRESANNHITVKPVSLMSWLITLSTRPGQVVMDPFSGSGTTIIAAKLLGRNAVGFELNQEYADIANARLAAWNADYPTLDIESVRKKCVDRIAKATPPAGVRNLFTFEEAVDVGE